MKIVIWKFICGLALGDAGKGEWPDGGLAGNARWKLNGGWAKAPKYCLRVPRAGRGGGGPDKILPRGDWSGVFAGW